MVLGIQLFGVGFGLFMLYLFFLHYKRRDITRLEFMAWLALWAAFLLVTLWPNVLDIVIITFQFKRTLDLFVVMGVVFIVFMTLYIYLKMRASSNKLDRLVRKLAIEQAKKK